MSVGGVMLAVPTGAASREVVDAVLAVLSRQGLPVRVSEGVGALFPIPNLVVAVDGWGHMPLTEVIVNVRNLLPGRPTLAIVTDKQTTARVLLRAGFDDAVEWPVEVAELQDRVRARLRDAPPPWPASIALDPTHLGLRCGDVHIRFTRAQFRLLRALIQAPDRWTTTPQLAAALGAPGAGRTPVAIHVHAIRRKLEQDAWRLRSHRGLGYFFDVSSPDVTARRTSKKR